MLYELEPGIAVSPADVIAARRVGSNHLRVTLRTGEIIEVQYSYGPDADDALEELVKRANAPPLVTVQNTELPAEQPASPHGQCQKDLECILTNGHRGDCDPFPF